MMPFGNQTSLGNRAFCTAMIRWVMLRVKGEGQWQEEMGCAGCKRLFRSRHRTRSKWHLAFQGASPWEGRAGPDVLVVHTWRYSTNSLATTYIKIKKWNWCFQAHQVSCVWVCCSCACEGKGWLCSVMLCYKSEVIHPGWIYQFFVAIDKYCQEFELIMQPVITRLDMETLGGKRLKNKPCVLCGTCGGLEQFQHLVSELVQLVELEQPLTSDIMCFSNDFRNVFVSCCSLWSVQTLPALLHVPSLLGKLRKTTEVLDRNWAATAGLDLNCQLQCSCCSPRSWDGMGQWRNPMESQY